MGRCLKATTSPHCTHEVNKPATCSSHYEFCHGDLKPLKQWAKINWSAFNVVPLGIFGGFCFGFTAMWYTSSSIGNLHEKTLKRRNEADRTSILYTFPAFRLKTWRSWFTFNKEWHFLFHASGLVSCLGFACLFLGLSPPDCELLDGRQPFIHLCPPAI